MVATELEMKKAEQRERELREVAKKARAEMASVTALAPPANANHATRIERMVQDLEERAKRERDMMLEGRRRQRERERRREASTNKKITSTRGKDRDINERIALGMARGTTGGGGELEVAYDERLFNQDRGMGSGFAADDQYNVYSERLFAAQPTLSALHRPSKHGDSDTYGGDVNEQLEKRFFGDPDERAAGKRERTVEFDTTKESGEDYYDPFVELDEYITRMMEGIKH